MKIFCSGSCRLLTAINTGYDKVTPIHSMFRNFTGNNFMGKLHNTKQHIQFIKFIKNKIIIPPEILPKFLTSYNESSCNCKCEDFSLIPSKIENIQKDFDNCEWYLFEICSLKLYRYKGFEVQFEHTDEYETIIQSESELLYDLKEIRNMIPKNKKILFQVHFRPNIIYNNENQKIDKRETIYNVIKQFCEMEDNTYMYDPSIIIRDCHGLYDGDTHFHQPGHEASFKYIYDNYLSKSNN